MSHVFERAKHNFLYFEKDIFTMYFRFYVNKLCFEQVKGNWTNDSIDFFNNLYQTKKTAPSQ